MTIDVLKRILTAFADDPADIDVRHGRLVAQVHEELLEAKILMKDERLIVVENDIEYLAKDWIVKRVAKLPLLADRILNYIPEEKSFVIPSGEILGGIDDQPNDVPIFKQDTVQTAIEYLEKDFLGSTSILYLTSDAGEGKTTLINQIARSQAKKYKSKETKWLLLPISLGGRTFLRFDDIIIGSLMNRLRFPMLYFDSFIELVRLGVVVPALDGFEELFIDNVSGGTVSAFGNLMQSLKSAGRVLISSRKSFFEYRSMDKQAQLLDTLNDNSVTFARLELERWNSENFFEYCRKRNIKNSQEIYDEVSSKIGSDHPLLTRAVLVRRLVEIAESLKDRSELLRRISSDNYFEQFINSIIEREVQEKWIDKNGEPRGPLLTIEEHHELLSMIAEEMWINMSEILEGPIIDSMAEIFCTDRKKSPDISNQIINRIKTHALITKQDDSKFYQFDHEQFYHFFLGKALVEILSKGKHPDIRSILSVASIPKLSLTTAILEFKNISLEKTLSLIDTLLEICKPEGPASFTKENVSEIIINLIDGRRCGGKVVEGCSFPSDSLKKIKIEGVYFKNCYFRPTLLDPEMENCSFENCQFEKLEISSSQTPKNIVFNHSKIHCLNIEGRSIPLFDPQSIESELQRRSFEIVDENISQGIIELNQPDELLVLMEKAIHAFYRGTEVNRNVFKQRLGNKADDFLENILPRLIDVKVIKEIFIEEGANPRYRLNIKLQKLIDVYSNCGGKFENFLEQIQENKEVD